LAVIQNIGLVFVIEPKGFRGHGNASGRADAEVGVDYNSDFHIFIFT
jgi:hypothetical protein